MTVTEYAGSVDAPAAGDPLDVIAATVANEAPAPRARVTPWEFQYITAAVVLDAGAAFAAGVAAYIAWPGSDALPTLYFALTVAMPAIWLSSLGLADSYDRSRLAVGPEEFNRIGLAGLGLLAAVALVAWTTQTDIPRGFVAVALFGAMAGSALARFGLRKYVHRQRRHGRFLRRTVLVGLPHSVATLGEHLGRFDHHGFALAGVCLTQTHDTVATSDPQLLSPLDGILATIAETRADSVAIASEHNLTSEELRGLSWRLERTGTNLFVAPSLAEVAGPRLSVHPVEGLSLLHVESPTFTGVKRIVKDLTDLFVATFALVALAPVFLAVAVAVKLDSPGPVFFRQTRVGRLGEPFRILKFRSMVTDAEDQRHAVEHLNEGSGPLFKTRNDPRVTKVGAFLRRTSLDELPQLWNVVLGEMSLVGPRPHLPDEVVTFGPTSRRRLFVKPGITGMWQVSGRSDLSWEESVAADLRYVDNWSLGLDAMIVWKTIGVVVRRDGAY